MQSVRNGWLFMGRGYSWYMYFKGAYATTETSKHVLILWLFAPSLGYVIQA